MRIQAMVLAALTLAGCGTVQTVVRSDQAAVDSLKEQKSYCGAVPRIYSGLAYDFAACMRLWARALMPTITKTPRFPWC